MPQVTFEMTCFILIFCSDPHLCHVASVSYPGKYCPIIKCEEHQGHVPGEYPAAYIPIVAVTSTLHAIFTLGSIIMCVKYRRIRRENRALIRQMGDHGIVRTYMYISKNLTIIIAFAFRK